MHKQVSALLSAGGSPGKLAAFGIALGQAGLDIKTIGGAEWLHDGPVTLILKADGPAKMAAFEGVCSSLEVPWVSFPIVAVELADTQGSLGAAAAALDDINIYSVLVLDPHGELAVVGFGVRPGDTGEAISRLTTAGYTAKVLENPGEPNDAWDERTEHLLHVWDNQVPRDDPQFWQPPGQGA